MATQLYHAGRAGDAVALLRRLRARLEHEPRLNNLLGTFLLSQKLFAESVPYLEASLRVNPSQANVHNNLGSALFRMGHNDRAIAHLRQAIALEPRAVQPKVSLVFALLAGSDVDEATRVALEAHALAPNMMLVLHAVDSAYFTACRVRDQIDFLRRVRDGLEPKVRVWAQTSLMLPLLYDDRASAREVFEEHALLGRLLSEACVPVPGAFASTREPDRVLRIGYCSQDFRNRSAGHFIESIVRAHDRSKFELYFYHHTISEDELTERLKACATGWRAIQDLNNVQAAELARKDRIDIFVDLTGYTGLGRVAICAHRAAPVQATYMGYAHSTCLREMDYRFVDALTDPVPGADALTRENLVRLSPCFLCYTPPHHAPEVGPVPSVARGGAFTFGSFNTHRKISATCLDLWAAVLARVPGSRLLVKNESLKSEQISRRFIGEMERRGIGAERLDVRSETPGKREHMAMYDHVDVALDSFPYHGTTTTIEALWMGVPTVSLVGDSHVSRVGLSLLSVVGLPELACATREAYIEKAAELAGDPQRLVAWRGTMRERVAKSPLCDAQGFTRRLEAVYRDLWRAWCARE